MRNKVLTLFFCCMAVYTIACAHKIKMRSGRLTKSVFAIVPPVPDYTYISSKDGQVMIYPNPASDKLYVKGDAQTVYFIQLTNMIGASVLNEEIRNGVVSLADLQPGIYILRISGADGQLYLSSKLIIQ